MRLEERASSSTVSSETLVYELDIFILIVILVFSLVNLPRVLVYIANNRSEVFQGCFFRSSKRFRMHRSPSPSELVSPSEEKKVLEYRISTPEAAASPKQPWHFPMRFSLRHPAAGFMQYRILGDFTVIQVLLMAGYSAAVSYAVLYKSHLFSQPHRPGWVAASQIPFVYAFATKNNIIGLLVGVGYEKLNYLHRHVGMLVVIASNIHAIGYIYKWSFAGKFSQMVTKPNILWGFITLFCVDLLGFFSIQSVRTKFYNLFFVTHVVGLVAMLIAACFHEQACIPYVIAGSAVYGLDHIIRAIKTRFVTATLRTIPELGVTRVDIPSLNTGWRPGQHVRLRVLSTRLGFLRMAEIHPFTISSATNTEEGLVLMCKRTGKWTKKLYEMASTTGFDEQGLRSGRRVKVMVEGPYGGLGDITVSNYSGALFVVGGSGVTFALSAVQDLVLAGDRSRTDVIEVVWCVADPAALEDFVPLFGALVSQNNPARLRVSVFYTRAIDPSFEGPALPPGITLTAGRPSITALMDGFIVSMSSKGSSPHGAFVAVCGPVSLSRDVARVVRTYDMNSKKAIGGVQFHEEVFGW